MTQTSLETVPARLRAAIDVLFRLRNFRIIQQFRLWRRPIPDWKRTLVAWNGMKVSTGASAHAAISRRFLDRFMAINQIV